ncbi:MAG TPA: M14 family zinc carboxypeptidase [Planctomycetota bacterium]|nr:M14 family zinc carboxypeptidase [Planctomycetota bacterium]
MPDEAKPLPKPGMDPTTAPPWWLTKPKEIRDFLESLAGVKVEEIGHTAGGRPVVAAAWGEREDLPGRTSKSLASALSGGDATAFYGKGERKRQVLLFVGAAHGTEWDGTVAALHYLNILVTGKDLLGREWPKVAETGRRHRFVLIPILNVDGRERALDHVHWINVTPDYMMMISQGLTNEGEVLQWPTAKLRCPIPPDGVKILGTYYNDAGMNLVYDAPFAADCQPETDALLRLCRREMPDCVVLSHSNNGSLVEAPASFIPPHYRQKVQQVAAVVGMRCHKEGFAKSRMPNRLASYAGDIFYQTDAVYHACGALPVLIEFPCGWQNLPDSHRGILDIGLAVLDEIALFGSAYRFRPKDPLVKL